MALIHPLNKILAFYFLLPHTIKRRGENFSFHSTSREPEKKMSIEPENIESEEEFDLENLLDDISPEAALGSLGLKPVGRKLPLKALFVRNLEAGDIYAAATTSATEPVGTPPLKKLRDSHHEMARLLASGLKNIEVSQITGYSASRISILKNDPAFRDLLAFYAEQQEEAFVNVKSRLAGLSLDAVGVLSERIIDAPDEVKTSELLDIAKLGLDRTGFGPSTKTETSVQHLTKETLDDLKAALQDRTGKVIMGEILLEEGSSS